MALSNDVNLPKSYKATFPDRCVVCGHEGPTSRPRVITGSIGWWTWVFWWWGTPFLVRPPACTWCAWRLQLGRLATLVVTIAIVAVVFWLVWPMVDGTVPRSLRKWVMAGIVLVCLIPQILGEMFFPPPFSVTAFEKSVDYEFRSFIQAMEFALHNLDAEWVKVNSQMIKNKQSSS